MDRPVIYTQEQGRSTDFLFGQRAAMIGLAKLTEAALGTGTLVAGLAATPTAPASLSVNVAPGQIYALANVDATAYGTLLADTTHSIVKQGLLMDQAVLTCTAPGTTGNSINYLIQATYQDQDTTNVVLPYYNSANPSQPLNGQNNTGAAQPTERQGVCVVSLKAGVSATTGTQTTPAPDAGYVGLWVVTVANGQTQINSGGIVAYGSAPFVSETLTQKISQTTADARYATQVAFQQNAYSVAAAGGTANAITGSYTPAVTALTNGMTLLVRAGSGNTGTTPTFSPNGLTAKTIVKGAGSAVAVGDIAGAGHWVELQYDSTLDKWVLLNPATGVVSVYGPKAWVVFAGASGTILKSSPGISSVTRNATGDYTINISAGVLADTNYGATFGCEATGANVSSVVTGKVSGTKTQTAYQITAYINTGTPSTLDPATVTVALYD